MIIRVSFQSVYEFVFLLFAGFIIPEFRQLGRLPADRSFSVLAETEVAYAAVDSKGFCMVDSCLKIMAAGKGFRRGRIYIYAGL